MLLVPFVLPPVIATSKANFTNQLKILHHHVPHLLPLRRKTWTTTQKIFRILRANITLMDFSKGVIAYRGGFFLDFHAKWCLHCNNKRQTNAEEKNACGNLLFALGGHFNILYLSSCSLGSHLVSPLSDY